MPQTYQSVEHKFKQINQYQKQTVTTKTVKHIIIHLHLLVLSCTTILIVLMYYHHCISRIIYMYFMILAHFNTINIMLNIFVTYFD